MQSSDGLDRKRLFGLDFVDAASVDEVAEALLLAEPVTTDASSRVLPLVITPNVDQLVKRDRHVDAVACDLAERAQFVLVDGQPIVWASRLLKRPLQTRLAGSSLTASLWPQLVAAGRRVLVVAGSPSTANRIRAEGPTFTAVDAPMLDVTRRGELEQFAAACVESARSSNAEFVFVTLGYPKQCNIIDGMLRQWPAGEPVPVFLAVGASLDMYYGAVRRAPSLVQRAGLEWFFRFVQEPRRLFRRYFVDDLAFAPMVAREWNAQRGATRVQNGR